MYMVPRWRHVLFPSLGLKIWAVTFIVYVLESFLHTYIK